ncbi:MAG: adenylate/guanylate cyclase domain-containing protein [Holosporales bacterium]|jgi:adenylate cyclase|nr:adenylate/guanylate cyclase domain-containing protein [Holosporales bacterium]
MVKQSIEEIPVLKHIMKFISARKLRYDIVFSFMILFIIESIITFSFTYRSNHIVSLAFAKQTMGLHSQNILTQTKSYLDDVQKVVTVCSTLVDTQQKDGVYDDKIRSCLLEFLKLYPHFSNVFVGCANGNYIGVERRTSTARYITQADKPLPDNITFLVQAQNRLSTPISENWGYYNKEGEKVGEEKNEVFNFDPRTRPWFSMSEQKGGLVWTDVYEFSGSSSLCITAAVPMYGTSEGGIIKLSGVVGVDLLLDSLTEFMRAQKISENGLAFIVSKSGQMVATPFSTAPHETQATGARALISISEIPNKQINLAFQKYKEKPEEGKSIAFHFGGQQYLASFEKISEENNIDWSIGIVVPQSDFSKTVDDMQTSEMLIIILVAIIATLVTFYLSKRISSPIIAIAQETQRLKDFYQTEPLDIKSNIAEIQMMLDAISAMRASLQSFGKFVPKVLVRRLMQKGTEVKLGGKTCEVTMFFSDIQGFTTISETMVAEKLVLHLSDYLNELSAIIVECNGTIDKYIGDAIMAFWNAPNADRNHVFNACHAALLCQKRLDELNRKWELEKKPPLITRIGLHSAEVIVGNIGSDEKINYTLMGDNVNLGSRLEGANKVYHTSILASFNVYKAVNERFLFRPLDVVAVKGKKEGVKIYELVGQMSGDSRVLPTKEEVELCERFSHGFNLYLEHRWGEAIKQFEGLKEDFPQDYPSEMYLQRCLAFKENPPRKNWDGIFVMTTK